MPREPRKYEIIFTPGADPFAEGVRTVEAVGYDMAEGWLRFLNAAGDVVYMCAAGNVWSVRLRTDAKAAA